LLHAITWRRSETELISSELSEIVFNRIRCPILGTSYLSQDIIRGNEREINGFPNPNLRLAGCLHALNGAPIEFMLPPFELQEELGLRDNLDAPFVLLFVTDQGRFPLLVYVLSRPSNSI